MKTLIILGGGTGGTMVANRMSRQLNHDEWRIIVIDRDETHYYQPGFLFIPFGIYQPADVVKPKKNFLPKTVEVIFSEVERIEPDANRILLADGGRTLHYDELVIATGSGIHPEETEGLKGEGWYETIFDFYTPTGAAALQSFLSTWQGGRLVLNVAEMPIKCPVAPLEFLFLADWYFQKRGIRHKVDLVYATPLSGAFTKPRAAAVLGDLLSEKAIHVEADFNISAVDAGKQAIHAYDGRELPYDVLVSVPTHMGDPVIGRSGPGDELNFVPTNKHTLQANDHDNIWVIGDATNVPTSKAGSVAHFQLHTVTENILRHSTGKAPQPSFDGHANCFIESGFGKAILIDFNYEVEPIEGMFPLSGVGPMPLLKEARINHMGKLAFKWVYWHMLLHGRPLPIPTQMSLAGKQLTTSPN